jgi:L-threonylcarbamoyladenylate synthase
MPSHPVAQALIRASQTALAAPSANRFGRISPTSATAVEEELGDRISYILDGGSCTIGVESTVLTWDSNGSPWILRQGGTPQEKIEKVLNTSIQSRTQAAHAPASPGMLESHYAPRKSLYLLPKKISELEKADWTAIQTLLKQKAPPASPLGLIVMGGDPTPLASQLNHSLGRCFDVHSLSHSNSVEEMAKNLFATMRLIDSSPVEVILSEPCTIELGLGHAIADRLKRASTRW